MSNLTNAINDFYSAFSDIPVPEDIDGCPCCILDKEVENLLSASLREITRDDLSSFASSALLTVGVESDYLYFLPRILDLSINDDSWWPDIEITGMRIHSTNLDSWPTKRREALESLLDAVIQNILQSKEYGRLDDWLCAIALMEIDVRPRLAMIESDPDAVFEYYGDNAEKLDSGRLSNAFWELPNEGHDMIVQWLNSDAISSIYWSHFR